MIIVMCVIISYSTTLIKNNVKLCEIALTVGNSSLELWDLKLRYGRTARQSFRGTMPVSKPSSKIVEAIIHSQDLINSQPAYDPSNWQNPVVIDIMATKKRSTAQASPAPALITAVKDKQPLRIKSILNKEGMRVLTDGRDANDNSALHAAAINGDTLILEMLLVFMVPDKLSSLKTMTSVDMLNNLNETPLFLAIKAGNDACTEILMADPGADAALKQVNSLGMTCFFAASYAGNVDLMERFACMGLDVGVCDHKGNTALHAAAAQGQVAAIELLVAKGWGHLESRNSARWTPLHWAACNGRTAACELLIKLGAGINAIGSAEETPCFLAFARRHLDTFKALLYLGGEAVSSDKPLNLERIRKVISKTDSNDIVQEMQRLRNWPVYFGMKRTYLNMH